MTDGSRAEGTTALPRARGMRDLLPGDMRAFRRVEDAFRASAQRWGYEEIRTPTVESYSLFTAAGALSPEMLARAYTFLDWDGWSGERVMLRYDSTIPVVRAAVEAGIPLPARLFYVQSVFRGDEGEEWQCGIEYVGAPAGIGDLEVAAVACDTLDALAVPLQIRLGHAGVARAALDSCAGGDSFERRSLGDRVAREGLAALRDALGERPQAAAFITAASEVRGGPQALVNLIALADAGLPDAVRCLRELHEVAAALTAAGRDVAIDLSAPTDFEYYAGVTFEFVSGPTTWGRGGRYVPGGGDATPPTACGLGLDAARLAASLRDSTTRRQPVGITASTDGDLGAALDLARALHRHGIAAALGDGDAAEVRVTVGASGMTARTADGERSGATLDDVVELLLRSK